MVLAAGGALGADYYVKPTGSDGAAGTSWATALLTISNGIAKANPGETVWVTNGTYAITVQLRINKDITVRSVNGPAVTKVSAGGVNGRRVFNVTGTNAVLNGFLITGGRFDDWSSPGAGLYLASGTATNCIISNNYAYVYGAGVYQSGGTVRNCIVRNNFGHSTSGSSCGGIYLVAGTVRDCVITNNNGCSGTGGIYLSGGLVQDCRIVNNPAGWSGYSSSGAGVRMAGGALERCRIERNGSWFYCLNGAGVYITAGLLRNCLVANNQAASRGGGIYMTGGQVVNCTVARNTAPDSGAGIHLAGGAVTNSIVYDNGSSVYPLLNTNVTRTAGTFSHSCATPAVAGLNNLATDPLFYNSVAGDFRLTAGSPCLEAGTNQAWMTGAWDYTGTNDRIRSARVDMGALENEPATSGVLRCEFTASTNVAPGSLAAVFMATAAGTNTAITSYVWDFTNDGTPDIAGPTRAIVTNTYGVGFHTVRLTVTNALGQTATRVRTDYIRVAPTNVYIALNGTHKAPFETWNRAATSILAAVSSTYSAPGVTATIWVSNGTFTVSGPVTLTKAIRFRSFKGPATTKITAGGVNGRRVFYVTNAAATVEGFTITGGRFDDWTSPGAGIYLGAGTVTNCIISNNYAYVYGAGIYQCGGTVRNCVIRNNFGHSTSGNSCGGIYLVSGTVRDCVITNNNGCSGTGGIYMSGGTVQDCRIVNNPAGWSGYSLSGAGLKMAGGIVERCRIEGNGNAVYCLDGGGAYLTGGLLRNSLVINNLALNRGGGIYMTGGTVANCTVARNASTESGAGIHLGGGCVTNSVAYLNGVSVYPSMHVNVTRAAGTFIRSCATPAVPGVGNLAVDPCFQDATGGDFRLAGASSCLDAGTNQAWMAGAKDFTASNDRIQNGRVDMGAYENLPATAGVLRCDFSTPTNTAVSTLDAVFTATVAGTNTTITSYVWDFTNDGTPDRAGPTRGVVTNTYGVGFYTVKLTVTNSLGQVASRTRVQYIRVAPTVTYVAPTGSHSPPFETWGRAATNLLEAFESAYTAGGVIPTIWVTNGTYTLTAQLDFRYRDILLRSVKGPAVTTIRRASNRVVWMKATNGVLEGFTIRDGYANAWEGGYGLKLEAGLVTNCIVTACHSYTDGGGVNMSGGSLVNSTIRQNYVNGSGGIGGGVAVSGGVLRRCVVWGNNAYQYAGGLRLTGGLVEQCVIGGNWHAWSSSQGAGAYVSGGVMQNCLVASNGWVNPTYTVSGGGIRLAGGRVVNCTVATNQAATAGGGMHGTSGSATNVIVFRNKAGASNDAMGTAVFRYSCAPELAAGANGNLSGNPQFKNPLAGDYRLAEGSPCANTGTNQAWMAGALDLDLRQRIMGSRVDMGAYEASVTSRGSIFSFR